MSPASTSVLFLFLAIAVVPFVNGDLTCRDENGDPVDWFIMYKMPRLKHHPEPLVRKGIGYFYMDANRPEFVLSTKNLTHKNHALFYTLAPVYDSASDSTMGQKQTIVDSDLGYVFYNDQTPDGKWSEKYGHTKGSLALDQKSGWWLVHSLPHFPNELAYGYGIHHNAYFFGQTFLCLSLPTVAFSTVGDHLLYTYPWAYDFRIPAWLSSQFPSLAATTEGKHVKKKPFFHLGHLQTLAGVDFKLFGKTGKWGKDLYHDLVAPKLGFPLLVETWRRDTKVVLPSNCSKPYDVNNAAYLDFGTKDSKFSYDEDHAKWAITKPSADFTGNTLRVGDQWICIGGINRESTQFRRGGGTVCSMSPQIWSEFNRIISDTEPCP